MYITVILKFTQALGNKFALEKSHSFKFFVSLGFFLTCKVKLPTLHTFILEHLKYVHKMRLCFSCSSRVCFLCWERRCVQKSVVPLSALGRIEASQTLTWFWLLSGD